MGYQTILGCMILHYNAPHNLTSHSNCWQFHKFFGVTRDMWHSWASHRTSFRLLENECNAQLYFLSATVKDRIEFTDHWQVCHEVGLWVIKAIRCEQASPPLYCIGLKIEILYSWICLIWKLTFISTFWALHHF